MITQIAYRNATTDKEIPVSSTSPLPITNGLTDLSPLDNKAFTVTTTAIQITAVAGTKRILIKAVGDHSGGNALYIGKVGVTTSIGLPLNNNINGVYQNTREAFIIDTTTPNEYYLISNIVLGIDVRVLYLG